MSQNKLFVQGIISSSSASKGRLLCCSAGIALALAASSAQAQETAGAAPAGAEEAASPIVVTGSRVARDGYNMPTPVTVVGEEDIESGARPNLAGFIQELPAVASSTNTGTGNAAISSGAAGLNSVNLRALGNSRTLVLIDGRRSPGSTIDGTVDINTIPQGLVQSVQIVTGGASAAYGSDAVSGVVNFILNKNFTGLKGSVEAGETTYGDDFAWKASLTGGMSFMEGRGHFLFNGEIAERDGIFGAPRAWNQDGWALISNPYYTPTNGQPDWIVTDGAGPSLMTPGGLITNTALKGIYFGEGGTVNNLAYGDVRGGDMIGGDWQITQTNDTQSLHASEERKGAFARLSFELADRLEVFGEASWNRYSGTGWGGAQRNEGNIVIRADNAFLPEEVRTLAADLGITQFNLGTSHGDLGGEQGNRETRNWREVQRYVFGFNGGFDALGTEWSWDASYQIGITDTHEEVGTTNNARMAMARDAVFHPDTQEIVCRSSIADPGNGCVPYNIMGVNVNGPEVVDYLIDYIWREQTFKQQVGALNVTTNIDNSWFAPIGLAFGVEHRKEEVSGFVPPEYQDGWFTGNYLPSFGSYDVTEAYLETVLPFTDWLEVNAAVRGTDYSTSGYVTTWKVGATVDVMEGLRFRATRSRDIRAPNLAELFQAGQRRTNTLIDPFSNDAVVQFLENTTGNPDLTPEIANSWGAGVVFRPQFIPGLALSVDYFDIKIDGAIGTVSAQDIVDRCFAGNASFCPAIIRGTNSSGVEVITELRNSPFNFSSERARGLDLEASYNVPLDEVVASWDGSLSLRAIASHYIELVSDNGIDPPTDAAGQNSGGGVPSWIYRLSATYQGERARLSVTGRGISAGVYSNSHIECTANCPPSSALARTINNNRIDGAFYVDAYLEYALTLDPVRTRAFFSVTNLFNTDPAIVGQGPSGSAHLNVATNKGLYDFLGRVFRVGIRFEL